MSNKRTIKKILDYSLTAIVAIFIISIIFVPLKYFSAYGFFLIQIAIILFIVTIAMDLFYFAKDSDKRRWGEKKKDDRKIFGIKRKIFFSIIEWSGLLLLVLVLFYMKEGKIGKANCPDDVSGNTDANLKIKYFYSPFCTYCWLQEPILRDAIKKYGGGYSLERYDIRYCKAEAEKYKVSGTPSFVFILKNESKEFVSYGYIPKDKFFDTIQKLNKEKIHIHPTLNITICGEDVKLPYNAGTKEVHTHDDLPKIHIEADNISLGDFFKLIELKFDGNCIGSYCTGDKCPDNKIGALKMHVNGLANDEFHMYVPKDNESIVIEYS